MINIKFTFYHSVWAKYLSVIRILLKRSATADQNLVMNRIDFERAGGSRKSGYRFVLNYIDGKPDTFVSDNDLAQTFVSVLSGDEVIQDHLLKYNYTFTFTSKCQLQIKNNSTSKQTQIPVSADEEALLS